MEIECFFYLVIVLSANVAHIKWRVWSLKYEIIKCKGVSSFIISAHYDHVFTRWFVDLGKLGILKIM